MKNLVQSIKELVFSQKCSVCGTVANNYYICDKCYRKLRKMATLKQYENFYYVFFYDRDIKNIITDFKLKNRKNMAKELATLVRNPLNELIEKEKIDFVIPIPISKKRKNERGFNQVELLLEECKIEYITTERIKETKHMFEILTNKGREKNISGAFGVVGNLKLDNKRVLIVDDIITTGSTIYEMERTLKKVFKNIQITVFSIAISRNFNLK